MAPRGEYSYADLPSSFVVAVLELLPVDSRLASAGVCRPWRAAAASAPALWTHVDLSPRAGVAPRAATGATLLAACTRAGAQLVSINLTGCTGVARSDLGSLPASCAKALREFHLSSLRHDGDDELLAFYAKIIAEHFSALQVLSLDTVVADDTEEEGGPLLRAEPPYPPCTTVRRLRIISCNCTSIKQICAFHKGGGASQNA